jgi:hypothetical protein
MAVQLHPDRIDLVRLRLWAEEWDAEGDGACWPAQRFVEWVERNLADRADDRGLGTKEAGQRRRRAGTT